MALYMYYILHILYIYIFYDILYTIEIYRMPSRFLLICYASLLRLEYIFLGFMIYDNTLL